MLTTRALTSLCLVAMSCLGTGLVAGQNYPSKSIRIIPGEAGGSTDVAARLIAQGIAGPLGQPVIVDNRPSIIGVETVSKAAPDGYTVLFQGNLIWIQPLLQTNIPWDATRDFSPITLAIRQPTILVVHPSLSVKSVRELIVLAKGQPGALNYASSAPGTASHLAAELFKSLAGVSIVHIPFKGGGPAITALISGQVQVMFPSAGAVTTHLRSGRLRALAVGGAEPSALVPDLPTIAGAGLPGYESSSLQGMFAPAKTPEAIINRLNQEIVRVLNRSDVKEKLFSAGVEVVGSSPEQLAAAVKVDTENMSKVIRDNSIRIE